MNDHKPDDADRHARGTLPANPAQGCEPVAPAVGARRPIAFRSYGDILAAVAAKPREWVVEGLLSLASVVLLLGLAKRAGKSTFAWALAAAIEHATTFLGQTMRGGRAVILSEEADPDLADKIKRFRLATYSGAVLSRSAAVPMPSFADAIRAATAHAKAISATVLVVDTFAFWAALAGSSENDAGAVMEALRPLSEAADAGLLVLLVHHPSKADGREGGNAARGSSALAGAVEATIQIQPVGGTEHPNRRRLHVESRSVGTKDLLVELVEGSADLGSPDRFDLIGDAPKIERRETDDAIIAFLVSRAPAWFRREEVGEGVTGRGGETLVRLSALAGAGRVARIGAGRAGDPGFFAALGTPVPVDFKGTVPAVPGRSPSVPGNAASSGVPMSVPAVPASSMNGGTGMDSDPRGKNTRRRAHDEATGNGLPTPRRSRRRDEASAAKCSRTDRVAKAAAADLFRASSSRTFAPDPTRDATNRNGDPR